ncbi:glycosyltransferase family 2 protein [Kitasatospora viridis]|uniref:Glycosyltransferase involved in cell wall biosynthesis n=1 Tax=Kitasatospora viridis TaxID=281105 RepID=A0A561TV33_9ACTN|nr:glycosyltransferase family A protein [Kitasatospora viridis]TWF90965.1 glycosyltransferase involved in cell wall biosynthesis [Kitasatospora viridis]
MADRVAPVSVVIAAYNAERTLGAALESALRQDPGPAEVIVVDDGSLDGTARIAAAHPGVQLLRQRNQGPSAARNAGIARATQPWVAFLDADDLWLPGKLDRQLRALERDPQAVLLAGDWVRDERAATAVPAGPVSRPGYRDVLLLNRFQTSTVLVRADVLDRAGGFDPSLDGAEDWDLWLRCARLGPVLKLDVPLVVYRDEPTGYSKDLVRLYRRMLPMLHREQARPRTRDTLTAGAFAQVMAWHHLRFAVAFVLAGQHRQVGEVARELRLAGLLRHVPAATVRHLVPFLGGRALRRLRPGA